MISCFTIIKKNEIVNKFLLAGNKFIPEIHLKQLGFTCSACRPFTKKKEFKNLKKQQTENIFIEMNLIKPVVSMVWLMEILNI